MALESKYISFKEDETGADRSGCGENGYGGDLEDSFHTTLAFSQDQFSTNQLLRCDFPTSLFHLTSNKLSDLT